MGTSRRHTVGGDAGVRAAGGRPWAAGHLFWGVPAAGAAAVVTTSGNTDTHVILRGGRSGPNYSASHVAKALDLVTAAGLPRRLMVDASHGNSGKDHRRQAVVTRSRLRAWVGSNLTRKKSSKIVRRAGHLQISKSIPKSLGSSVLQRAISAAAERPGSVVRPFSSILPKIILPLAVCSTLVTEMSTDLPIILRALSTTTMVPSSRYATP